MKGKIYFTTVKLLLTSDQIYAFKKGDNAPLTEVYKNCSLQLVFVAYKYLNNTDEAKDVTMEVFNKLLQMNAEKRSKIPADPEAFKNWLFLVTKNYCLDAIRHHKIVLKYQQEHAGETGVQADVERKWDAETVAVLLNKLPDAEQRVCRMHYEGFSNEEIAQQLDISYNTVRNQLSSGKKRIRRYISGNLIVLLFLLVIAL